MTKDNRSPGAALVVAAVALLVFLLLAVDVLAHGPLMPFDQQSVVAIHSWAMRQPPQLAQFAWFWSWLGREGIVIIGAVLGLYWLARREWDRFTLVLLGVGGAEALFQITSNAINRTRPAFPDALEKLTVPGFPSGHTASAVLMFGVIYYVFAPYLRSPGLRRALLALMVAIMLAIGLSRLFLGVHYPTDVLAGYALGIAWGGVVFYAVRNYYGLGTAPWPAGPEGAKQGVAR